jgi:hypothetical protein
MAFLEAKPTPGITPALGTKSGLIEVLSVGPHFCGQ